MSRILLAAFAALAVACGGGRNDEPADAGCSAAETDCSGSCVLTASDPAHCGSCDKACDAADSCVSGACVHLDCRQAGVTCPDKTYCSLNDGRCLPGCALSSQCASGSTCDLGTHTCVCDTGKHKCDGTCVTEDATSCGATCEACPAPSNGAASCVNGTCQQGCIAGQTHLCGGACVSNATVDHCGSSCTACTAPAHSTATCDGTACGFTCDPGFSPCNGACVDLTSDNANCGACMSSCSSWQACSASKCRNVCVGTPGFGTAHAVPSTAGLAPFGLGDFTGDGVDDLALLDGGQIMIATGHADGGFSTPAYRGGFASAPEEPGVADVDGSGRGDAVGVISYQVVPLLGQSGGGFTAGVSASGMGTVFHHVIGDVNGDGKDDVVTIDDGRDGIGVALGGVSGYGTPSMIGLNSLVVSRVPVALSLCDFNHDGKLDLAVSDTYTPTFIGDPKGEIKVLLNGASGLSTPNNVFSGAAPGGKLVAGNFAAAGSCDIVYDDNGSLKLLLNNGSGAFTVSSNSPLLTGATINGLWRLPFHGKGGVDDLLVLNGSTLTLFHGGYGTLTGGGSLGVSGVSCATGLVDGDLIPDLIVGGATGGATLLLGQCQ